MPVVPVDSLDARFRIGSPLMLQAKTADAISIHLPALAYIALQPQEETVTATEKMFFRELPLFANHLPMCVIRGGAQITGNYRELYQPVRAATSAYRQWWSKGQFPWIASPGEFAKTR